MGVQSLDVITQQGDALERAVRCGLKATDYPIPANTLIAVRAAFFFQEMTAASAAPAAFADLRAREGSVVALTAIQ